MAPAPGTSTYLTDHEEASESLFHEFVRSPGASRAPPEGPQRELECRSGLCLESPQANRRLRVTDTSRCVILVPAARTIEPHCEFSLRQLEAEGYPVRRLYGFAQIDVARNRFASEAIAD